MLEHGIEDDQEFTHAGDQGDFLGLARGHQPLVELPQHRIPPDRHHGGHVESCAHVSPATPNHPFPAPVASVPVQGRYPPRATTCLLERVPNSGRCARRLKVRAGPTPSTLRKRSSCSRHRGTLPETVAQVLVQVPQLLLQHGQHPVNALVHHGKGTMATLEFGSVHLQHLAPTSHQRPQIPSLLIRQRPGHGSDDRPEVRQHLGIQTVGFSQFAHGAGKTPHLAWIDHGYRNTRSTQGHCDGGFMPPVASNTTR